MKKPMLTAACLIALYMTAISQTCTPQGDQNTYGTNDTWIGYVYDDVARSVYMGYVNEGVPGNPDFDQSFGGASVSYPTNGCPVSTSTFGVRYKLLKNFTAGTYSITVGGDDGYRLSVDGGSTWAINRYSDQSYVTTTVMVSLSGPTSMVLEYYENGSDNRISFAVSASCSGAENQALYGTANTWYGYLYDGTAFNAYAGRVSKGVSSNANFDESFGGTNIIYATSGCGVQTETFSARYRLQKSFVNKSVSFTIGGDDGFRFSIDGGATWLINRWVAQSYTTALATVNLNGTYDLVLEYFENNGDNRVSFASTENIILPLRLVSFTAKKSLGGIGLHWTVMTDNETLTAEPQRSEDGINFISMAKIPTPTPVPEKWSASYTDNTPAPDRSWYRLKLTGTDGQVTYSGLIPFNTQGEDRQPVVSIYPTVIEAQSQITLVSSGRIHQASLLIRDAGGRLLAREQLGTLEASQVTQVALSKFRLRTGLHFISVVDSDGQAVVRKLIVR